jgi:hypothetical protein
MEFSKGDFMRLLPIGLMVIISLLLTIGVGMAQPLAGFTGSALDKSNTLTLPAGKPVFVAIGFDHVAQKPLEEALLRAKFTQPSWQLAEIPVIDEKYKSYRTPIRAFMKTKVGNESLMSSIYPWYTQPEGLKQRLGVNGDMLFLLLSPTGEELWRKTTVPSAQELGNLNRRLAACSFTKKVC